MTLRKKICLCDKNVNFAHMLKHTLMSKPDGWYWSTISCINDSHIIGSGMANHRPWSICVQYMQTMLKNLLCHILDNMCNSVRSHTVHKWRHLLFQWRHSSVTECGHSNICSHGLFKLINRKHPSTALLALCEGNLRVTRVGVKYVWSNTIKYIKR